MAYRPTDLTERRKAAIRARIVAAAHKRVARGGFREAQVAAVAEAAGIATGTVYRHFESKAALCAEVFRRASQQEVDVMAAIAAEGGPARRRLERALAVFARRAIKGRTLAYALIAEPVDPAVEAERLRYRRAYAEVLAAILKDGIKAGVFPRQEPEISAACLVGALAEALVGPLAPGHALSAAASERLVDAVVRFCLRAAGVPHAETSAASLFEAAG